MDIILLGAGGQAKDIIKNIEDINAASSRAGKINLLGCIDDTNPENRRVAGYEVFNSLKVLNRPSLRKAFVVIAVGDPLNKLKFLKKLKPYNIRFANIIHPSVRIPKTAKVGVGVTIFASSVLSSYCRIGNHVSINYLCSISHDCVVGDYATLSPGVKLCGRVTAGEGVFFGVNSCCINNVKVGKWGVVGAGTVVNTDVSPLSIVAGIPNRVIGRRDMKKSII